MPSEDFLFIGTLSGCSTTCSVISCFALSVRVCFPLFLNTYLPVSRYRSKYYYLLLLLLIIISTCPQFLIKFNHEERNPKYHLYLRCMKYIIKKRVSLYFIDRRETGVKSTLEEKHGWEWMSGYNLFFNVMYIWTV